MEPQAYFQSWAVVELFGHQKEAGYVTSEAYGGAVMFRIDQPELPAREWTLERPEYNSATGQLMPAGTVVRRDAIPARSRLVSPGAIYALNPCTEEVAVRALERMLQPKLIIVQLSALATGGTLPTSDANETTAEDAEYA